MSILPFHLRESPIVPVTWQDRLNSAATERDVVGVVRDYVATLSPGDLERLPEPCRPGKFLNADDVTIFAFALVRHDCAVDGAAFRLVQKLSDFFSKASMRLAQIIPRSSAQDDEERSA